MPKNDETYMGLGGDPEDLSKRLTQATHNLKEAAKSLAKGGGMPTDISKNFDTAARALQHGLLKTGKDVSEMLTEAGHFTTEGLEALREVSENFAEYGVRLPAAAMKALEESAGEMLNSYEIIRNRMDDAIEASGERVEEAFSRIPSNAFTKFFGIDRFAETLKEKVKANLETALEQGVAGSSGFGIGIWAAIAGSLILAGKLLWDMREAMKGIATDTGFTFQQLQGINKIVPDISVDLSNIGASLEDVADAAAGLLTNFGTLDVVNEKVLSNTVMISKALGVSGKEAADLVGSFRDITGDSIESAQNMIAAASAVARFNNVSAKAVIEDIAANAEDAAKWFGDSTDELVRSAVAAKKLGLELKTAFSLADSLLDVSSSIEAEMEANVLLGTRLNFMEARRLALAGDMTGMMQNISNQLSDQVDLNSLNAIQRDSLAKSLGIEQKELSRLINGRKILAELSESQASSAEIFTKALQGQISFSEAMDAAGLQDDWDQIKNSVIAIGKSIGNILLPVLEVIFKYILKPTLWVVEKIAGAFSALGNSAVIWVGLLTLAIRKLKIVSFLSGMIGKAWSAMIGKFGGSKLGKMAGGAAKASKAGGGGIFGSMFGNPKAMIKNAASLIILAGALFIAAKGFQEFASVEWSGIGKGIVGILALTVAMAGLGALMMSGIGTVAIFSGIAALTAMGGAVFILGKGLGVLVPELMLLTTLSAGALGSIGSSLFPLAAGLTALGGALILLAPGLAIMKALGGFEVLTAALGGGAPSAPAERGTTQSNEMKILKEIRDAIINKPVPNMTIDGVRLNRRLATVTSQGRL